MEDTICKHQEKLANVVLKYPQELKYPLTNSRRQ